MKVAASLSKQDPQAQAAAARLVAAACRGESSLWAQQESRHELALSPAEAATAAAPLVALCASCPVVSECERWAIVERYDGIAAGTVWAAGEKRPVGWLRSQPRLAVASDDELLQSA